MLIFLHGYPNTFRMWDNMIQLLQNDYLILNISYPNFAEELKLKWGLDLNLIPSFIKATIENVEKINKKNYKKMIISHDWGALFTYLFDTEFPGYVDDLVTLDIGIGGDDSIKSKLLSVGYQLYLASAFVIGGRIGDFMTKALMEYFFPRAWGISDSEYERIDSSFNYPYYYIWKNIGTYKAKLASYKPSGPICFVYGTKKKKMDVPQ